MLVKFFSRGKGGGSAPVDYLLGKDRKREKASVLRGNPEQVKELIDGLSFARNYTSGCLSFAEKDIPEHQKQKLMDAFQDTLMAGLDRNQYDVLWVEHKDKDRLELNFLIPNVELSTNKRLQPYYDKNDRHYVNAWQQVANDTFKFKDPHDPANKRFVTTAKDLPNDRKQAVSLITNSLANEVSQGAISNRADVINKLQSYGLEIARQTKSSISIKDPDGGKNIRLKGALYERNFKGSADVTAEITRAIESYRADRKERLSAAKKTFANAHQAKRKANSERYRPNDKQSTATPDEHNVQCVDGVSSWSDIRSKSSRGRTAHNTEIKHTVINQVVENNVRCKSGISESIKAVIRAVRTAVQRSKSADKRVSRTNNFAHQLRAKQQPSFIARRKNSKRIERDYQKSERGISMPRM
jgi:hypothetical protein